MVLLAGIYYPEGYIKISVLGLKNAENELRKMWKSSPGFLLLFGFLRKALPGTRAPERGSSDGVVICDVRRHDLLFEIDATTMPSE